MKVPTNDNFGKIINNLNVSTANQTQKKPGIPKADNNARSFADILKAKENVKAAESKTLNVNELKLRQLQLNNKAQGLTFSKHAQQRLEQRNIDVAPELMAKIGDASRKAYNKNIKNALIISDGAAFIVNTASNIVVTTMNNSEMRDNIITNIDGTVIL